MAVEAFQSLRGDKGVDFAAVDSASASLFLTKAYSEKETQKLLSKLARIEHTHIPTESRWARSDARFIDALAKLRGQRVARCVAGMYGIWMVNGLLIQD